MVNKANAREWVPDLRQTMESKESLKRIHRMDKVCRDCQWHPFNHRRCPYRNMDECLIEQRMPFLCDICKWSDDCHGENIFIQDGLWICEWFHKG
jgi:hypothetical protein